MGWFNEQKDANPASKPAVAAAAFEDCAPTWAELQALVEARQAALGVPPPDLQNGPPSADALLRTFGTTGTPRIKLYRDHATWCPYCHKIILQVRRAPREPPSVASSAALLDAPLHTPLPL